MGKRILTQKRGRGISQYRAPKIGKIAPLRYPHPSRNFVKGTISNILRESGRAAPIAQVSFENMSAYLPAVEGMEKGAEIQCGPSAFASVGNILHLGKILPGTSICNIELIHGDGGKLVKSPGSAAIVTSHSPKGTSVKLPSGRIVLLNSESRAMLGMVAGGGRNEKPFLTAGRRFHLMRSRRRLYPRMRGIAMAAVHHPFGGGRHQHPGKSTSTSRNAPPGRKVGHIAPRKTGRKRIPKIFKTSE